MVIEGFEDGLEDRFASVRRNLQTFTSTLATTPPTNTSTATSTQADALAALASGAGTVRLDLGGITVVDRKGQIIAVLETVAEDVAIDVVNSRG